MIYSSLSFEDKTQEEIAKGIHTLARAVGTTLGPMGRNVAIAYADPYGSIYQRKVLHDGVTVAKAIQLENEHENMGAQILKEAAQKQVDQVGDGTTVSILLGDAIFTEMRALMVAGINPMRLRRSIEQQVESLCKEIEAKAIPVTTFEQKKQIATISAEDPELGELVAKVIEEMGEDGLVTTESSRSADTKVDKIEGMQLDKGYVHQWFVTDPERNEATLENPLVLVTDRPINTLVGLKTLLEYCNANGKSLFIITPHIGKDALAASLANKANGVVHSLVVSAPLFGKHQKQMLQDIATFTGGKFISEDAGDRFENINPEDLGKCDHVTATQNETIIVGGKGTKEAIDDRIASIQQSLESKELGEFDQEKLRERLAKLTTGVAVIRVGGVTEIEMNERLERVKDAVAATKAALQKGIVPGGETVYLQVRKGLRYAEVEGASREERMAAELLYNALYRPFKTLLSNAGLNDGEWYNKWENEKGKNMGVDVVSEGLVDMVKDGIVDPTLVPVHALQNASSVAIQMATTYCNIIQYKPKDK